MSPKKPKVTVVIPNYNHARYLPQRIESVLNQTYQDFEVLYLDDASTDNSNEVFSQYENHPKIRSILNSKNSGSPFVQWNRGVREAKGEYVWIAEADDYADPRFLETLVPLLDSNEKIGLTYCESLTVDEDDNILGSCETNNAKLDPTQWKQDFVCDGPQMCARFMIFTNVVPNASGVLFRKSVYEAVGYADEKMRLCGDWKLWAKMMLASDVGFSAQNLNYFRTHKKSVRGTIGRSEKTMLEVCNVLDFVGKRSPVTPENFKEAIRRVTNLWLYHFNGSAFSFRSHLRIYRVIRRVDGAVEWRIIMKLLHSILWKFGWRNVKYD